MEREISNFIKVWLLVLASLCYSYVIGKATPKGTPRLLFLIPVICLFLYIPLTLSSLHFGGLMAFFIAWLANFKLLLFSFGKGPLASSNSNSNSDQSPISFTLFIAISCFPIKITKNPSHKVAQNCHKVSLLNYATKGLLLALVLKVYDYSDYFHPKALLCLYCFHIYFFLELILAALAAVARAGLGVELEPQFNEPYLASSLQDFWGKRWNLMVTSILRPTVYDPTLKLFSVYVVGRKWAPLPAVMATFVVSALMHELVFFYLGRLRPNWEISGFFVLHGLCFCVEIVLKKVFGENWKLPRLVSGGLTVVFVMSTSLWLFIPQFLRIQADVRMLEEYAALGGFLRNVTHSLSPFL